MFDFHEWHIFRNMRKRKKTQSEKIFKVFTLDVFSEEPGGFNAEMCGWYPNIIQAIKAVHRNECDIQDGIFNYAMISKSLPGMYGLEDEEVYWYKWNSETKHWDLLYGDKPSACIGFHISM